jgi:hypothetical protein
MFPGKTIENDGKEKPITNLSRLDRVLCRFGKVKIVAIDIDVGAALLALPICPKAPQNPRNIPEARSTPNNTVFPRAKGRGRTAPFQSGLLLDIPRECNDGFNAILACAKNARISRRDAPAFPSSRFQNAIVTNSIPRAESPAERLLGERRRTRSARNQGPASKCKTGSPNTVCR